MTTTKGKSIFSVILFSVVVANTIKSQDYFPLEIGNRWDFSVGVDGHGYTDSYETSTIITDTVKLKNKNYFIFSNERPLFDSPYLRLENDSLFSFYVYDSTERFVLAFDTTATNFEKLSTEEYFGETDSQFVFYGSKFSKKFGLLSIEHHPFASYYYRIIGCIISKKEYGSLLSTPIISNNYIFQLKQNYPNPFNPTTVVSYSLPIDSKVKIEIFNALGQSVGVLINSNESAGYYETTWNASNLPSGIYFINITANGVNSTESFTQVKKALLLK